MGRGAAHILSLLLLFAVLSAACGRKEPAPAPELVAGRHEDVYADAEQRVGTAVSEKTFSDAVTLGVTPWGEAEKMRQAYLPFATYLSDKLRARVRLMIVQEYNELLNDLRRGVIQIASFSPGAYADALDAGIEKDALYVASAQLNGKDYYRGIIVTKSSITSLAALRGKTFAFVEQASSSGYKFPLALFLSRRIDPYRYFSKVYFLGSHPNVVDAVIAGRVEAGATWDGYIEENFPAKKPDLRVLLKTDPIPYDAVVVERRRGDKFAARVRQALLSLKKDSLNSSGQKVISSETGFPYSGYVVHSSRIYDIVRRTGKLVGGYRPAGASK